VVYQAFIDGLPKQMKDKKKAYYRIDIMAGYDRQDICCNMTYSDKGCTLSII